MEFIELLNTECDFYGVSQLRFKLDGRVWEAIAEDVNAAEVNVPPAGDGFFPKSLARVRMELAANDEFNGWQLIDIDGGHCWLSFGFCMKRECSSRWRFEFCFLK